jgi:hypothetical protein
LKTNYVLVDYENVQPESLDALDQENIKIIVFVGANQTKIPFELAAGLQRMGERAQYVKIAGNGTNALDFHIAFYLGLLMKQEPTAYFHIISKDTGFDPLVKHLKKSKVLVLRSQSVADIPLVKAAQKQAPAAPPPPVSSNGAAVAKPPVQPERIAAILTNLRKQGKARPGTLQALFNSINTLFGENLPGPTLHALLKELRKQGIISVNGDKVVYTLPDQP